MSVIEVSNLYKNYKNGSVITEVLKDINLKVEEGEMLAIMGPSGSGKSTLINIIGCIDKADKGMYLISGKNVQDIKYNKLAKVRNKNIGFIFQKFNLIEDLKVIDNVMVPLRYNKKLKLNKKKLASEILEKVGLGDQQNKYPRQLSGGQQQRVAIARALVNEPDIILADEPTGALDKENGEKIMKLLEDINNEGKTIVIITHDINVAKRCKRIIKIEDGSII